MPEEPILYILSKADDTSQLTFHGLTDERGIAASWWTWPGNVVFACKLGQVRYQPMEALEF
jgi:hypothetical protein